MKRFIPAVMVMPLTFLLLACMTATNTYAQNTRNEKTVRAYYSGFENKDWNTIAGQLADGYTFTSPAGDDHISVEAFKMKCFPTSRFTKKVSFLKMVENGNELFVLVQINTTDNKIVRNVDLFTFDSLGKIRSHECFFGAGIGFPGHNTH